MVKKKTKSTVSIFGRQIPSWVFVTSLLLVVFAGFIGYNAVLNEQDRQKFVRMEEVVDTLVSRLGNEFEVDEINNTSYCYEPGRKLEKAQTICVYEQSVVGRFTKPGIVSSFITEQTDLVSVREDNTENIYLISSDGRNCGYEYKNANLVIIRCLGNTDFQHYTKIN